MIATTKAAAEAFASLIHEGAQSRRGDPDG